MSFISTAERVDTIDMFPDHVICRNRQVGATVTSVGYDPIRRRTDNASLLGGMDIMMSGTEASDAPVLSATPAVGSRRSDNTCNVSKHSQHMELCGFNRSMITRADDRLYRYRDLEGWGWWV